MEFVPFAEKYAKEWDGFCIENDLASLWHATFFMKIVLNRRSYIRSENHSFFIKDSKEILAIVPLTVDRNTVESDSGTEMNYGGFNVPMPIVSKNLKAKGRDKVLKGIYKEIDSIAELNDVYRLNIMIPLEFDYRTSHNYNNILVEFGFHDYRQNTQILKLSVSEESIWCGLSNNHKRSIKKGQKYLNFRLFTGENISENIIELFKSFYFEAAGKITHPDTFFGVLYDIIKNNYGVLGQALYRGKVVGYMFNVFFKDRAFYLLGANLRGFDVCPIAHLLHWELIKYLKKIGILSYELGLQQFRSTIYEQPTKKELSISRFKKGFGGETMPVYIGEKFYSKDYFKKTWEKRIQGYLNDNNILLKNKLNN
jgi:hypothetical protein